MDGSKARWLPLAGVVAPILWYAGVAVSESGGVPADDATADDILEYFISNSGTVLLGGVLFIAGAVLFALFISVLRSRWRAGGAEDSAAVAMAAGTIGVAFIAATWAPQIGIGVAIEDMSSPLTPATAEAALRMGTGFFVIGEMFLGLFLFAAAAANGKTRLLPSWLSWFAIVLGVIALVPPIGWAAVVFGLPIWSIISAIYIYRAPGPIAPAT